MLDLKITKNYWVITWRNYGVKTKSMYSRKVLKKHGVPFRRPEARYSSTYNYLEYVHNHVTPSKDFILNK